MTGKLEEQRLDELIRKFLRVSKETRLSDDTEMTELKAAEWRVIDLAIAVESEFGVKMSADKALALKTIGDWRNLIQGR